MRDKSELYKRRRSKKKPGDSEEEDEEGVCYDREPRAEGTQSVCQIKPCATITNHAEGTQSVCQIKACHT